jgi:hypothetical protein
MEKDMKEDPTFKERFGISTPIRYVSDLVVEPRWQKKYDSAWKKFLRENEMVGSIYRRLRFDAFLRKIARLGDDLPYTKRVAIRHINSKVGYGVFAKENIGPYSILNHYAGILRPDKAIAVDNDSTFEFSEFPAFSIDGKVAGNWCRFMNHSPERDPHTNVVAWEHYSKWGPRIIFTACHRGIKKGDQLLYSYGDSYWEENKKMVKL